MLNMMIAAMDTIKHILWRTLLKACRSLAGRVGAELLIKGPTVPVFVTSFMFDPGIVPYESPGGHFFDATGGLDTGGNLC